MLLARRTLLSTSYRNAIINSLGLVGYWRLGETAGTVVRDQLGKNDGAYTGSPTLGVAGALSGDPNTAVTFASGKYAAGFASKMTLPGTRTIIAWINSTSTARQGIVGTRGGGNTGAVLTANLSGAGNLSYYHTGTGATTKAGGLTTGSWFQVGVTFNATGGGVELFVNGASIGTDTGIPTDGSDSFNGVIGDEDVSVGTPFLGTIDEVSMWNRVLTNAEIANLYRIGRGF